MTNITGIKIFDQMKEWQKQHEANFAKTEYAIQNSKNENELNTIYDEFYSETEKIGYEYNFMEGKDPTDEQIYNEQLLKLGQGEVLSMDRDGDGEISFAEYILSEKEDLTEIDDKDMLAETLTMSTILFDIIDQKMGNSDSSGTLSAEEFASFYKNLDQFNLDENSNGYLSNEFDGKFNINEASDFASFLVLNTVKPETYNDLREIYEEML